MGPFGVRGELRIRAVEADALRAGLEIILHSKDGDTHRVTIDAVRRHGKDFVARLEGFESPDAVAGLRGASITVSREQLPALGVGAYRAADLIGLDVIDEKLGSLGTVREVRRYPSSDMLVVGPRSVLVPMLRAYGIHVDARRRTIRIELPEGFEELT